MASSDSSSVFTFSGVKTSEVSAADSDSLDELAASLAGSFNVSSDRNNPNAPHPRFSQYKARYSSIEQQERRRKILELQKKKRSETVNLVRQLADNTWESATRNEKPDHEDMEVTEERISKPGRYYKNQLMLSEWMLDVPENLDTDWVMVPCPVGRRNLVIASSGLTSQYAKNGYCHSKFPSSLPGGRKGADFKGQDVTILDTIYSETANTFYILDMMCWKQMPLYDSDTEFRLYWLHTQFQENPGLKEKGRKNPHRFEPLPNFSCSRENLEKVMAVKMNLELDGLLFYHKKTHYTFGATPLVLWLKPYMMTELLGVRIPDHFFSSIPSHYQGFEKHKETVQSEKIRAERQQVMATSGVTPPKSNKKKGRKSSDKMEVASEHNT